MGMSSHVVAIRPPDTKWLQMKKVWDACVGAGIDPPTEVEDFFNGESPDPTGVVVELENTASVERYEDGENTRNGFEVHLDKLPPDVKIIRFWNAW